MPFKKFAKAFGSKEIILNYANRRWGFTKTNKVGEVMALIPQMPSANIPRVAGLVFQESFYKYQTPNKDDQRNIDGTGPAIA